MIAWHHIIRHGTISQKTHAEWLIKQSRKKKGGTNLVQMLLAASGMGDANIQLECEKLEFQREVADCRNKLELARRQSDRDERKYQHELLMAKMEMEKQEHEIERQECQENLALEKQRFELERLEFKARLAGNGADNYSKKAEVVVRMII